MKHLKLYEKKFNENSLKKFAEEKEELYSLIKEYSIINNLYDFDEDDIVIDIYYEHNVAKIGDEVIIVTTINSKTAEQREDKFYPISELDDLNRFIENPERYKTSKKYNL